MKLLAGLLLAIKAENEECGPANHKVGVHSGKFPVFSKMTKMSKNRDLYFCSKERIFISTSPVNFRLQIIATCNNDFFDTLKIRNLRFSKRLKSG